MLSIPSCACQSSVSSLEKCLLSLLRWVVCFFDVELYELFVNIYSIT